MRPRDSHASAWRMRYACTRARRKTYEINTHTYIYIAHPGTRLHVHVGLAQARPNYTVEYVLYAHDVI